jgi:hypothetical protein
LAQFFYLAVKSTLAEDEGDAASVEVAEAEEVVASLVFFGSWALAAYFLVGSESNPEKRQSSARIS